MPSKKPGNGGSYPRQAAAYPQQQQYGVPQTQYGFPPQQPGMYPGYYYSQQTPMVEGYGMFGELPPPPYSGPGIPAYPLQEQAAYAPPQYQQSPPQVLAHGAFDAGARFDSAGQHVIPPPPPGMMPNAAQMAHAQGHTVVATQRSTDLFGGGSGGGYVFW